MERNQENAPQMANRRSVSSRSEEFLRRIRSIPTLKMQIRRFITKCIAGHRKQPALVNESDSVGSDGSQRGLTVTIDDNIRSSEDTSRRCLESQMPHVNGKGSTMRPTVNRNDIMTDNNSGLPRFSYPKISPCHLIDSSVQTFAEDEGPSTSTPPPRPENSNHQRLPFTTMPNPRRAYFKSHSDSKLCINNRAYLVASSAPVRNINAPKQQRCEILEACMCLWKMDEEEHENSEGEEEEQYENTDYDSEESQDEYTGRRMSVTYHRFELLSMPAKRQALECNELPIKVKESALNYVATPRIKKLATPIIKTENPDRKPRPIVVNRAALSYVPTERIIKLSTPPPKKYAQHNKPCPERVKPATLRYKPTPRILKLSTPVERVEEVQCESLPREIPKHALKYKPTQRIKALAVPVKKTQRRMERKNPFQVKKEALEYEPTSITKYLANPRWIRDVRYYAPRPRKSICELRRKLHTKVKWHSSVSVR